MGILVRSFFIPRAGRSLPPASVRSLSTVIDEGSDEAGQRHPSDQTESYSSVG